MTEFAINTTKNMNIGHMSFELNCGYHPRNSSENETDSRLRSRLADKLGKKLKDLIVIRQQNLLHA